MWTLALMLCVAAAPVDELRAALTSRVMQGGALCVKGTLDDEAREALAAVEPFGELKSAAGKRRWSDEGAEIWLRDGERGEKLLALFNRGKRPVSIDVVFPELGLPLTMRVYDVWRKQDRERVEGGFAERVDPGRASLLRLKP